MSAFVVILIPLALFLMLRANPQRKRVMAQRALLGNLGPGDQVITAGGMIATVVGIDGDRAALEVAPGVVVEFLVPAIARRLDPTPPAAAGGADGAPGGTALDLDLTHHLDVPDDLSSMRLPHPAAGPDAIDQHPTQGSPDAATPADTPAPRPEED